jgi:hypothetical protein
MDTTPRDGSSSSGDVGTSVAALFGTAALPVPLQSLASVEVRDVVNGGEAPGDGAPIAAG